MSARKPGRGLGRGIGEILGGRDPADGGRPLELRTDSLRPGPWQPRTRMDPKALKELSQTIGARGVLQPILVRVADGGHEIIAGERRWRAAQMAGLATVPVVVRELSDRDALLVALLENIQREDLHVLEQARAAKRIVDELSISVSEAATSLGMSRPALSNMLRLLTLDPEVSRLLADDAISAGHARAIAALPRGLQARLARSAAEGGLTVRQVEALAARARAPSKRKGTKGADAQDEDTKILCRELSARLGMRVSISGTGSRGKVVVHYRDAEGLDALLKLLRRR